jgi:hypothetical protein
MGDVKSRLAAVRARRVRKNGWNYDASAFEALRRAEEFFGSKDKLGVATAMAEVLFPDPGRGRKRGAKTWDSEKHLQLGFAYYEVKEERPHLSDAKIAEIISKRPEFNGYSKNHELLRQRLGEAKRQWALCMRDQMAEYLASRDDDSD